jgi:hypothetical protein
VWRFDLHCESEETGSPGMICVMCHQVLRHPSEYCTSSMGNGLLAKAHMTKFNKSTESKVSEWTKSTVNETALPILNSQKR